MNGTGWLVAQQALRQSFGEREMHYTINMQVCVVLLIIGFVIIIVSFAKLLR